MSLDKKTQTTELPSSDYLNFIKMNKLKLLERRSDTNPKIFNKGYKFRIGYNPEQTTQQQNIFHTLEKEDISQRKKLRNKNYQMYYRAHLGQQVFNRLQQVKSQHVRLETSVEEKAKRISKLVYGGSDLQLKKRDQSKCSSKEKSISKKSIVALVTIDKSSGEIKFPTIKKLSVKTQPGNSKQKLNLHKTIQQKQKNSKSLNHSYQYLFFANKKRIITKPEHQKIIQTFYEYQRLLKEKDMVVNGVPHMRHILAKNQEQISIAPVRKRLKTECIQVSIEPSIELKEIRQQIIQQHESKELLPIKNVFLKPSKTNISKTCTQTPLNSSQQIILNSSNINNASKLIKKRYPTLQQRQETVYDLKVKNYREFVFKVNFAHSRLSAVTIKEQMPKNQLKYKAFIGKGNNNWLIKRLIKRRCWWSFEDQPEKCQFVWTQLKINRYLELQQKVAKQDNDRVIIDKTIKVQKKKFKLETQSPCKRSKNKPQMKSGLQKILDETDTKLFKKYLQLDLDQQKMEDFDNRAKYLQKRLIPLQIDTSQLYLHNHLEQSHHIGNKKALFYYMRQYCRLTNRNVFQYLPLTFHIKSGLKDKQYNDLVNEVKRRALHSRVLKKVRNIWIVKPGEVSNRGNGITVVGNLQDLNKALKQNQKHANGAEKTYIVQSYLDRPLLYNKRKFDIRHYMLITSLYGQIKCYWYSEGYIRTSSEEFCLDDLNNSMIHLTNDAIQKNGTSYGEFEDGNKLSYNDLQRYLDNVYPEKKVKFYESIYPRMKEIGTHAISATYMKLNPKRLQHGFQVLGLDFMIDEDFNVWMIEINTNPCLEISCPLLGRIIPNMVQQTLRLTLDVVFPPLCHFPNTQKHLFPDYCLDHLKFQLVFDQQRDGGELQKVYEQCGEMDWGQIQMGEQVFQNEGDEVCEIELQVI